MNTNMIIGGEHIFSPSFLYRKSKGYIGNLIEDFQSHYNVNFTFGGYYSILAIIDAIKLKFNNNSVVLLPSYVCTSVLKAFKVKDINYIFYKVDAELYIEVDYLISIIDENVKAIYFIDYFGASQLERLKPLIDDIRLKNIVLIQDIVQSLEIRKEFLFGDYIFNSFRKFFPFEGSLILSKNKLIIDYVNFKNKFICYKRTGQLMRYFHVKFNLFSSSHFLYFLQKSENCYFANGILRLPKFNIRQLDKYDIEFIVNKQKYYYSQLFNTFRDKIPMLLQKSDFVPSGFVIKIKDRDVIRKNMFDQNIFAQIHWTLSDEIDKNIFYESIFLSSTILTIPLISMNEIKYKYLIIMMKRYIIN